MSTWVIRSPFFETGGLLYLLFQNQLGLEGVLKLSTPQFYTIGKFRYVGRTKCPTTQFERARRQHLRRG
jgi:hypothetical protein